MAGFSAEVTWKRERALSSLLVLLSLVSLTCNPAFSQVFFIGRKEEATEISNYARATPQKTTKTNNKESDQLNHALHL